MVPILNLMAIYSPVFLAISVFLASILIDKVGNGLLYLGIIFVLTGVRMLINHLSRSPGATAETIDCDAKGLGWGQGWIYPVFVWSISFFYFSIPMFLAQQIHYPILLTLIIGWIGTSWLLYGQEQCSFGVQEYLGNAVGGAGLGALVAFGLYASSWRDLLYFTPHGTSKQPKKQTFRCAVSPTGEIKQMG